MAVIIGAFIKLTIKVTGTSNGDILVTLGDICLTEIKEAASRQIKKIISFKYFLNLPNTSAAYG